MSKLSITTLAISIILEHLLQERTTNPQYNLDQNLIINMNDISIALMLEEHMNDEHMI
jgi:hypothetical protein